MNQSRQSGLERFPVVRQQDLFCGPILEAVERDQCDLPRQPAEPGVFKADKNPHDRADFQTQVPRIVFKYPHLMGSVILLKMNWSFGKRSGGRCQNPTCGWRTGTYHVVHTRPGKHTNRIFPSGLHLSFRFFDTQYINRFSAVERYNLTQKRWIIGHQTVYTTSCQGAANTMVL